MGNVGTASGDPQMEEEERKQGSCGGCPLMSHDGGGRCH